MSGSIAAAVGGAVVGGVMSSRASSKASKAAGKANDASLAAELEMFETGREDFSPYTNLGKDAMPEYYRMLGLTPGGAQGQMTQEELALIQSYNDFQAGTPQQAPTQPAPPVAADPYGGNIGDPDMSFQGGFGGNIPTAPSASTATVGAEAAWGGDMDALNAAMRKQQMIEGSADTGAPDLSPLGRWQMEEFNRSQGRADAARGLSGSGGASGRQARGESGIYAQDYQNSYSRILDALGLGQASAAGESANAVGAAGAIGAAGDRTMSNINAAGQSEANMWSGIGNTVGEGVGKAITNYKPTPAPSAPLGNTNPVGGTYGGSSQYGMLI